MEACNSVTDIVSRVFRPYPRPNGVPFGVRSVGHVLLRPGHKRGSLTFPTDFGMIYWVLEGNGFIRMGERFHRLMPEHVAVYLPGVHSHVEARDESIEYRFFTVDGLGAAVILKGYSLPPRPFAVGRCPEKFFKALAKKLRVVGMAAEMEAGQMAYEELTRIALQAQKLPASNKSDESMQGVLGLLHEHASDAQVGINQIADLAEMDRSVLSRRFKETFGVSPQQYLTSLRLQSVLSLLKDTTLTLREIAGQAGFSSAHYLTKFFKDRMGVSPTQFRGQPQGE